MLQAMQKRVTIDVHLFEVRKDHQRDREASVQSHPPSEAAEEGGRVECIRMPARTADDIMVSVDRNKMSQVIHNLVSNAIKFTPSEGKVTVTATLESLCLSTIGCVVAETEKQSEDFLKVVVTDTGVGLTQVILKKENCNHGHDSFSALGVYSLLAVVAVLEFARILTVIVGNIQENIRLLFREHIQFNPERLQAGGVSGLGLFSTYITTSSIKYFNFIACPALILFIDLIVVEKVLYLYRLAGVLYVVHRSKSTSKSRLLLRHMKVRLVFNIKMTH